MIRGGALWFFPLSKLFFSLLTRNRLFLFSQAKEHALSHTLHITPFFCQFCEDFYFLQVAEQTIFFITFWWTMFFFFLKKKPPPHVSSARPLSCRVVEITYKAVIFKFCVLSSTDVDESHCEWPWFGGHWEWFLDREDQPFSGVSITESLLSPYELRLNIFGLLNISRKLWPLSLKVLQIII